MTKQNISELNTYGMSDFAYKILLDRYALKNPSKVLAVGDIVVALVQNGGEDMKQKREIGTVVSIDGEMLSVATHPHGDIITIAQALVDKPVETSPMEIWARVARGTSEAEDTPEKKAEWQRKFEWLLYDWKFVPGGRILTGAGTDQDVSYFNCFVLPSPHDSRGGIIKTLQDMMELMSRGGGVGFNISSLRPQNSYVKGVNGRSSGAVSFMDLYSLGTGLIQQAGCFAGDTRIATDKGLIPIAEIVTRMENNETFYAQTHTGMRQITDKFRNGVQPLLKITSKRGYSVSVTPNHPVAYMQDEKIADMRADKMIVGDKMLILAPSNNDSYIIGDDVQLAGIEDSVRGINYKMPTVMNSDLAYLLGYSYGDGCVKGSGGVSRHLSLAVNRDDTKTVEKLKTIIKSIFDYDVNIYYAKNDNALEMNIASVQIVAWLQNNGILKQKTGEIKVPEAIFRSDRESILSFVAGYFDADGSATVGKKTIKMTSICRTFLSDIQMLLAYCGIVSQIARYDRTKDGWKTIYELYVRGSFHKKRFADGVPSCKNTQIVVGTSDYTTMYHKSILIRFPKKYFSGAWDAKKENVSSNAMQKIHTKALTYGDNDTAVRINEHLNVMLDEIVSIEELPETETFDLTIEHEHKIGGNGVYTYNSRRGALMLMLNDWHPDLISFIHAKQNMTKVTNANISVGISDKFMEAVKSNSVWQLRFPDTSHPQYDAMWDGDMEKWEAKGYPVILYGKNESSDSHVTVPGGKPYQAKEIWDMIIKGAWSSAEPGLWFRERANQYSNSNYYEAGHLVGTNPCAEQGLPGYGICNLGAVNLSRFYHVANNDVDWELLKKTVSYGVRFLDNIIDESNYHIPETRSKATSERRLGLGIMGLAELLILMGVKYGSPEGITITQNIIGVMAESAYLTSADLAQEKGCFTEYKNTMLETSGYMRHMKDEKPHVYEAVAEKGLRNVTLLTVAPCGTTGTMAETSTGIEPFFALKWERNGRLGKHTEYLGIAKRWVDEHPDQELPYYFTTAMELTPYEHVAMQAAAQEWIDSAISKTCNAPNDYTLEQTSDLYMQMYDLGCKGGTIYRDGSRNEQVLTVVTSDKLATKTQNAHPPTTEHNGNKKSIKGIELKKQPNNMKAVCLRGDTPYGSVFITITEEPLATPFAVFITIGKSGSDLQAQGESMGRMFSLSIQSQPAHLRRQMLETLVEQNVGIGGARPTGFGKNKFSSFPDAVAKIIQSEYLSKDVSEQHSNENNISEEYTIIIHAESHNHDNKNGSNEDNISMIGANICPECHNSTFIQQDGCVKCVVCGYSEC